MSRNEVMEARAGASTTNVRGVTLHRLPLVEDARGLLAFAEHGEQIPFHAERFFLVFGVPAGEQVRGEHAHKQQHQFLVCVHGQCRVMADDGETREEFVLDHPSVGLYLPPMTWAYQYGYTEDAVLLVLNSGRYDISDYISDYDEFRKAHRPK